MTLEKLKLNDEGTLVSLCGHSYLVERLFELGFHKGRKLKVLRRSPFGGIIVQVGHSFFALREEEAKCLTIQL